MTISVIIPTYNRADSLERTLGYLLQSQELPTEVIIVDQTTKSDVAEKIAELAGQSPIIRLLRNEKPSITKARNTGIDAAQGEVVVFMDDDVDVQPDTFAEISRLFYADKQLAMVAGLNRGEESIAKNSMIGTLFGRSSYRRRFTGHVTKAVYGRFPVGLSEPVDTEWAMGFFFAVRKSVVDRFSLRFDENLQYYAYAEDLDFTYRFHEAACREGMTCRVYPHIVVTHNVSKEYRTPKRSATFMTVLHRHYLSKKLFGSFSSSLLTYWADFGSVLLAKAVTRQARDYVSAQIFCLRHSKDIKKGQFHYERFM